MLAATTRLLMRTSWTVADKFPEENDLLASRLGYWVRPGKHAMTPADWKTFMDFADKWMK